MNDQRKTSSLAMIWLLVMIMVSMAGCASAPLYRKHSDLSQRKRIIKTVGLMPPVISMYEYQAALGVKLVPKDEWSPAAAGEVTKAFISEMGDTPSPMVVIGGREERDLDEMVELFGPVDLSLRQHAYESKSGEMPPREPFPEKIRFLEYSLGPAREAMARKGVDAVWIVRGYNNVPTLGAKVKEGVEILLDVMAALGRAPAVTRTLIKIELSVALVDKDGTILFYNRIDDQQIGPVSQEYPDQAAGTKKVPEDGTPMGREYGEEDLRNPRVARHYIKTLLSDFRTEAAR
jgi:hypothetical protein